MLQVPESSSTGSMFTSEGSRHGAGLQPQAGRDWWRDDLDMDSGSELSLLAEDFSTQGVHRQVCFMLLCFETLPCLCWPSRLLGHPSACKHYNHTALV